jgi:hypothetical protein
LLEDVDGWEPSRDEFSNEGVEEEEEDGGAAAAVARSISDAMIE